MCIFLRGDLLSCGFYCLCLQMSKHNCYQLDTVRGSQFVQGKHKRLYHVLRKTSWRGGESCHEVTFDHASLCEILCQ